MAGLRDKKITIVGLARSGIGAANLLAGLSARVTVTDLKKDSDLRNVVDRLHPAVSCVLGNHPEEIFTTADLIVVSPGVPSDIPPLVKAREKGVPLIGELELAYQIICDHAPASGSRAQFLAVTGTNGKSTTTALLDFMMKKSGYRTTLGGNIGNALTEEIHKAFDGAPAADKSGLMFDFIVAEVSSFQLETINEFRPRGAVITNITPDHLDRYHSLQEYMDAKARIFENQKGGDFLVLNRDDPGTMKAASGKLEVKSEKPGVVYFSRKQEVDGIYAYDGTVFCKFSKPELSTLDSELIRSDQIKIKGVHNLENAMAASAVALLAGCPVEAVRNALREFPGLEHRLEFVREIEGVRYFNDSKGTNVAAVIKSLESFREPIVLIAGGRDKAGEFSLLRDLVKQRVKALVLIGEAAGKIGKALGDLTDTVRAKDLREAVHECRKLAQCGDAVLLSPACASFDMFDNFEDRGRQFKKIVLEMQ
ncbi:MAG: UDP-N-acetylmuramoyl-L-alanine--D-glutamate ligase [Nitrospirota bacterium]